MSGDQHLLTMIKPTGLARTCTAEEAHQVRCAWSDLLRWLHGHDPDTLDHAAVVGEVARKAALRSVRYPEYSVTTWAEQARDVPAPRCGDPEGRPEALSDIAEQLIRTLDFEQTDVHRCWLNRVTVELLYRDAPMFDAYRGVLVSHLLDGPVLIQLWRGSRRDLALAIKLLLRFCLGVPTLSNLIHMEHMSIDEYRLVRRSVQLDPAS